MKKHSRITAFSLASALLLAGCGNFSLDSINDRVETPTKATIKGSQQILANTPTNYGFTSESVDDYPLTYTVTWGDGAASAVPNVKSGVTVTGSHTWTTNGHYVITAKVSDGHGNTSQATYDIDVGTPEAKLSHPQQQTNVPQQPGSNNDTPESVLAHETVAPRGLH